MKDWSQGTGVHEKNERTGQRRKFTAEYKLLVVRRAEESKDNRTVSALLREEGLAASHLTKWRKQIERGQLAWLTHERSLQRAVRTAIDAGAFERQKKELARWKRRAVLAEGLVALQKQTLVESLDSGEKMNAAIEAARRSAAEIGVAAACAALGIPRATYYRALARKRRQRSDSRVQIAATGASNE